MNLRDLIDRFPATPGIMNRSKYFNAGVLVPIIERDGGYHLLFEVRKDGIRQGGEICFPGGRIDEADFDGVAAALRETCEELNICEDQVRVIGRLDSLVATMGIIVDVVVGLVEEACLDQIKKNDSEVERFFTLPVEWFIHNPPQEHRIRLEAQPSYMLEDGREEILLPSKALGLPQRYHQPWGFKHFPVYVYETPEGVIWGMTAEILTDLIQKWTAVQ